MRETRVTERDRSRLDTVAWGEKHFGSLTTNRQFPRRVMLRLAERGLVRSVGLVEGCDDDGWLKVPSRYAEGWVLTDAGRRAAEGSEHG